MDPTRRPAPEPVLTPRLRLEPIAAHHADDLYVVHADDDVAYWYDGALTRDQARDRAVDWANAWRVKGVHKWMAYERDSGALVGRGGLSRIDGFPVVEQIDGVLDDPAWRADPLELGWALLSAHRGRGYATEIGRAGLDHAFGALGSSVVVAWTEVHNVRSRAVMERLEMHYAGEFTGEGLVEGREGVHPDASFAVHVIQRRAVSP